MKLWYKVDDFYIDYRTDKNIQKYDPLEASKITVEYILENYPSPYYLMVSGGVDSQAMIYAWKQYGKDYIPTSVVFNDGINNEDLVTLKEFSHKENIEVYYKNFDLLNFYSNTYESIVYQYQCSSPQIGAYIGMTQDLNGTVIFAGMLTGESVWNFDHVQRSLIRYSFDRPVVPFFFCHTPEIWYCDLVRVEDKAETYQINGFPVISQNKSINLYTNFEGVKKYFDENFSEKVSIKDKLKFASKKSRRVHDILLRYPYEKIIGTPHYTLYSNNIMKW